MLEKQVQFSTKKEQVQLSREAIRLRQCSTIETKYILRHEEIYFEVCKSRLVERRETRTIASIIQEDIILVVASVYGPRFKSKVTQEMPLKNKR